MSLSKAIGIICGINDFGNLFLLVRSAVSYMRSQLSGLEEKKIKEDDVLQLQSDLQCLRDTLPAMYNLTDRAEWKIHIPCVAQLLAELKDAVYDVEDLLDEFRWYELKVKIEGNATQLSPLIDFFHSVTQGTFNKVTDIQKRLSNLSSQLEKMGLHEATPRFGKSIRPETTSFPTEAKIFGREEELLELIRLLGVPANNCRLKSKRKRTRHVAFSSSTSGRTTTTPNYNEAIIASVPVLPIVGIGGIGKSTIVQNITNHPQVKSHFDLIIWICVSDDFDVKRLTKEAIQSASGKEATTEHLDSLQRTLANVVNKKRFLLILDDMWDDALKGNGQCWNKFCAPFTKVLQGSMMLVTTRSQKVADGVRTMEAFPLEGLKDDVFWDFFKQCVFGSDSCNIEPNFGHICRCILPKLSAPPLAAKTFGRLLQIRPDSRYWNIILNSQLWELGQEKTDILPVLRLSYIYLPCHLKRCFSFCAVYPKGYKFEKHSLAEIWVAEGFVEPQSNISGHDIACQYFEDLVNQSFFQMVHGKYVIHNLMHDMAQLISKDECFIIKNVSDFQKVPQNVRHLSILRNNDVKCSMLLNLSKHTKLRTLLCNKSLKISTSVMDCWFRELHCMRVICFASTADIPESISNLKHLRYLKIAEGCTVKTLPSPFCELYNLEILYARKCRFQKLPSNFGKLINLQRFESQIFQYHRGYTVEIDVAAAEGLEKLRLINNLNQFCGDMTIYNLGAISKDHAAEAKIKEKEYLNSLTLLWSLMRSSEHNDLEVLEALHPPINLRHLDLEDYLGESLPSWFQPGNVPNLTSLRFCYCNGLKMISLSNKGSISTLSSLTELSIERCRNLSSLEQFLQPSCMPAIVKIKIEDCQRLVLLPTARFRELHCLQELKVSRCPNINSRYLLVPSLKKLELINSGTLADSIICCSLTYLCLSCPHLTSIQLDMWSLPVLQKLKITGCDSLISIERSKHSHDCGSSIQTFSSLAQLIISDCKKLQTLDDLLTHEYLPAIEIIHISCCEKLRSLPGERFGSFSELKGLKIWKCSSLNWQTGILLPPSLKRLILGYCRDIPAWFPCCLEKLTSLESLVIHSCMGIMSIPNHLWSSKLLSLQELCVCNCPDLVTVGGANEILSIKNVLIVDCRKLKELEQPLRTGRFL